MFDPRTELSSNRAVADSNGSWRPMDFGARPQRKARSWNGGDWQFGAETKVEDESGVFSPPLWKTSPSASPRGGSSPLHRRHPQNHYRSMSPASRMQAIAQGQRELMEMVRNMPESCYELSLKDLVEQPMAQPLQDPFAQQRKLGEEVANKRAKQKKKKNDTKPKMARSGSLDNGGFLLKMVFPVSLGSKKKKISATNTCSKVSPKPLASDGSAKSVDKEWWKKKVSVSGGDTNNSNSGRSGSSRSSRSSSSNSNSSSSRHGRGLLTGCWSYLHTKKRLTKE